MKRVRERNRQRTEEREQQKKTRLRAVRPLEGVKAVGAVGGDVSGRRAQRGLGDLQGPGAAAEGLGGGALSGRREEHLARCRVVEPA